MRTASEVLRHAQTLLYDPDDEERRGVISEIDAIIAALGVLPDLHEQIGRRYAVLFGGSEPGSRATL